MINFFHYLGILSALLVGAPAMAVNCAGALNAAIPVHRLSIAIKGNPIQSVEVVDQSAGERHEVFSVTYKPSLVLDETEVVSVSHVFSEDDNAPPAQRVVFGQVKPIMEKMAADSQLQAQFGWINGTMMTNQHRSIIFLATDDGTYFRDQDGPTRLLVVGLESHRVERVLEYQVSADERRWLEVEVGLDIHRVVMQYASFLDIQR